jgi:rare lipoprotein A
MGKLIIGWGLAVLVALTVQSEAGPPASFVESLHGHGRFRGTVTTLTELTLSAALNQELGVATWYGEESSGVTASGEVFDKKDLTAAHRTLPLGSRIEVTNLRNNRSLVLRVNDRGPNVAGRLLDVSRAAAERLGFIGSGRTSVRVRLVSLPRQYLERLEKTPAVCMLPPR